MTIGRIGIVSAGLLVLVGCAEDKRPVYAPPTLVPNQTVTLKGIKATFIDGVDGSRVDGPQNYQSVPFAGMTGGNEVLVTPGPHKVRVNVYSSGATFNSTDSQDMTVNCVAGHIYQFQPRSNFNHSPKVTDMTERAADNDGE